MDGGRGSDAGAADRTWRRPARRALLGGGAAAAIGAAAYPVASLLRPAPLAELKLIRRLRTEHVITAVAWSPDGTRIATASYMGGFVTVWDESGRVVTRIRRHGPDPSKFLNFTADGNEIVTQAREEASSDMALSIWSAHDGQLIRDIQGAIPGGGFPKNRARERILSRDRRWLAVRTAFLEDVILFNTYSCNISRILGFRPSWATAFGFANDGSRIAVASADGWVHFVDLKTWDLSARIPVFADVPPHCAGVIAFSPDDTRIVAATEHFSAYGQLPKPVRVVSATDGRVIASHKGDQLTRFVAWLPASGLVAFAGVDGKLVLWDPDVPGASMLAKQVSPLGNAFATTADGRRLAVAEGETLELFQINR